MPCQSINRQAAFCLRMSVDRLKWQTEHCAPYITATALRCCKHLPFNSSVSYGRRLRLSCTSSGREAGRLDHRRPPALCGPTRRRFNTTFGKTNCFTVEINTGSVDPGGRGVDNNHRARSIQTWQTCPTQSQNDDFVIVWSWATFKAHTWPMSVTIR